MSSPSQPTETAVYNSENALDSSSYVDIDGIEENVDNYIVGDYDMNAPGSEFETVVTKQLDLLDEDDFVDVM